MNNGIGAIIAVLDGGQADEEVLEMADLLRDRTGGPGLAIWVVDVPMNLALCQGQDAPINWEMVERSRRLAGLRGLSFEMIWGRSRSTTILDAARRASASGIVLVACRNRRQPERQEEWQEALLNKATCTVWLLRWNGDESDGQ